MAYNYIVTAQKSTNVLCSLPCQLATSNDLLVSKCTSLELYSFSVEEGLELVYSSSVFGRITNLAIIQQKSTQLVFMITKRFCYSVLKYVNNQFVTIHAGGVRESMGRCSDVVPKCILDFNSKLIGLHLFEGYLKLMEVDKMDAAFNVRLDELRVMDITILDGEKPTLCVLYEDAGAAKHVRTYSVEMDKKKIGAGPWHQANVESGANVLIPVKMPMGGVIIVGQQTIVYHSGVDHVAVSMMGTVIMAYCAVDDMGYRYILGDHNGKLLVVVLLPGEDGGVEKVRVDVLGNTSAPSTLSHLGNGVVYVGSSFGDSKLLKLHAEIQESSNSYVEELMTFTNIGPIVDFCVMDLDRRGQGQMVTCSGTYADGSLRVIRNGIGVNEQASVEIQGMKGMWALRKTKENAFDTYLVLSFTNDTRILAIQDDQMEEFTIEGFNQDTRSLYCGMMEEWNVWVQVTEKAVVIVDVHTKKVKDTWKPADTSQRITVATGDQQHILVALSGKLIVYLGVDPVTSNIIQLNSQSMPQEVSCLDISAFGNENKHEKQKNTSNHYCAVGFWTNVAVHVLKLPQLTSVLEESLSGDTIPRSVLFNTFGASFYYLLVGMGDGNLVCFYLNVSNKYTITGIESQKSLYLGSKPVLLSRFYTKEICYVFASCDRPTIIYTSPNNMVSKLLFSNVNTSKEVSVMSSFDSETFPECLAMAMENELVVGTIDEIQKLHIQSVPLKEWPRRIAYDPISNTLGVCTVTFAKDVSTGTEIVEQNYLRIFDDQHFTVLDSFAFDMMECICSILVTTFQGNEPYFVVGTAYAHEEEAEPSQGRIVVFSVLGSGSSRTLKQVAEVATRGAVYCLNNFNGKILAGVNSKTQLFKWEGLDDIDNAEMKAPEIVFECSHHGHILVMFLQSQDNYIIVGDLMKSISLLRYRTIDGFIEEIARDLNSNWMTAIDMLTSDIYIGAEADFNIFTVRHKTDALSDEDRIFLESQGSFHVGEFINCFRKGSLVMVPTETSSIIGPSQTWQSTLFGTVNGMIGVVLSISPQQYDFLSKIESAIATILPSIGNLDHTEWRTFRNKQKICPSTKMIDGDLIERFLDLSTTEMAKIIDHVNTQNPDSPNFTIDQVTCKIEEMQQAH